MVEILVDGDVEFLKAFIKYHRLDPAGFFYLLSEFLSELLDDRSQKFLNKSVLASNACFRSYGRTSNISANEAFLLSENYACG